MTGPVFSSYVYTSNAPDGVVCGRIGNFTMVSQLADEYTVQWHALGDILDWPTPNTDDARSKQAGAETLSSEYGKITGITGSEFYGYVFQQNAISKFTYVAGDVVFRIDVINSTVGCVDYNRFARVGDAIYFESEFGYQVLVDNQVAPIGLGKVNDSYKPVNVLTDEQRNVVASLGNDTVFYQGQNLAYNTKTDEWTRTPTFSGRVYYPVTGKDAMLGQIVYSGQSVDLQNSEGGVPATAKIVTTETDLNPGGRSLINGVRPIADGGTWTVRAGCRSNLSDSVDWSASTSINSRTGMANFRKEGRYHRAEFTCADGFNTAIGADVDFTPAGFV